MSQLFTGVVDLAGYDEPGTCQMDLDTLHIAREYAEKVCQFKAEETLDARRASESNSGCGSVASQNALTKHGTTTGKGYHANNLFQGHRYRRCELHWGPKFMTW